jgi:hypothetical protein
MPVRTELPIFHVILSWSPQQHKIIFLMHFGEGGGLDGWGMWHTLGEKKNRVLCGKPEGDRLCEG